MKLTLLLHVFYILVYVAVSQNEMVVYNSISHMLSGHIPFLTSSLKLNIP